VKARGNGCRTTTKSQVQQGALGLHGAHNMTRRGEAFDDAHRTTCLAGCPACRITQLGG
jgi:hypothetical protein